MESGGPLTVLGRGNDVSALCFSKIHLSRRVKINCWKERNLTFSVGLLKLHGGSTLWNCLLFLFLVGKSGVWQIVSVQSVLVFESKEARAN